MSSNDITVLVVLIQRVTCLVSVKKYEFAHVPVTGFEVTSEEVAAGGELSCILRCTEMTNGGTRCMGALFDEAARKCLLGNLVEEPQASDTDTVRVALSLGECFCITVVVVMVERFEH